MLLVLLACAAAIHHRHRQRWIHPLREHAFFAHRASAHAGYRSPPKSRTRSPIARQAKSRTRIQDTDRVSGKHHAKQQGRLGLNIHTLQALANEAAAILEKENEASDRAFEKLLKKDRLDARQEPNPPVAADTAQQAAAAQPDAATDPGAAAQPGAAKEPSDAAQPDAATDPDATAQPDAAAQPAAAVQRDAATEPDAAAQPAAAAQPDAATEPDAAAQPDAATDLDDAAQPDAATEPDAAAQPGAATEPDDAAQPDAATEPDTTVQSDAAAQSDAASQADAAAGDDTEPTEADADAQADAVGPGAASTDADADAAAQADVDAPSGAVQEDEDAPDTAVQEAEADEVDTEGAEPESDADQDDDGGARQAHEKEGAKRSLRPHQKVHSMEDDIEKKLESQALGDALGEIRKNIFDLKQDVAAIADDMEDGVRIATPKVDPWIEPLSTTMQCIINLTIQYFVVFTAAAAVRTFHNIMGLKNSNAETIVNCACDTVTYAPMLCVLFLGARMRALQITQGEGNPQDYARYAMQGCAWSVLIQTILVLIIPILTGEVVEVKDGNVVTHAAKANACAGIITIIRYSAMLMLYAGLTIVCVAIFLMDSRTLNARANIWDEPNTADVELSPPVSPAVSATINLSVQFFVVYLSYAVVRSLQSFNNSSTMKSIVNTFQVAKSTVDLAPMLCILFIGARMRALQMDPVHGAPQPWAQNCFYICAYSILAQTIMVLLAPLFGGGVKSGKFDGDVQVAGEAGAMTFVLVAIRYIALLANYGGFTVVIVSILIIENPQGHPTPALSPAMSCVMNLTMQYFAVFLALFVCQTICDFVGRTSRVMDTLIAARSTVMFCPMLSVLFVGTRMRALQLTDQRGSPQCWAQDAMYVATYATLIQLVMTLLIGVFVGPPKMDNDGNPVTPEVASHFVKLLLESGKWLTVFAIYGGSLAIVVSVLLIKKDTAHCHDPLFEY